VIALREQLPLLRVGRDEVIHYEESWISDIISEAAARSGSDDSWYADDIAKGVTLYLKERFSQTSIGLDELFDKIGRTLCAVGFDKVADHLKPSAPPTRLSLAHVADEAGTGFELWFFHHLGRKIDVLREVGTKRLHCSELKIAVERICQPRRWSQKCDLFQDEVLVFLALELSRAQAQSRVQLMVT
jgi:hypothetical protein